MLSWFVPVAEARERSLKPTSNCSVVEDLLLGGLGFANTFSGAIWLSKEARHGGLSLPESAWAGSGSGLGRASVEGLIVGSGVGRARPRVGRAPKRRPLQCAADTPIIKSSLPPCFL